MKIKKINLILIIMLIFVMYLTGNCFAKSQDLKSLEFDVNIDENGNMKVVETWNIDLYDTNTVFKTFEYPTNEFKDISVVEITNGINNEYKDVKELQYHVDRKGFYALENKDGDFEIAWNVDTEGKRATKQYKISYTVMNIIRQYKDCSELYWQFIGKDFSIPIQKLNGTIKLPKPVNNLEDFRVWAHGPLTGEITKVSSDTTNFKVAKVDAKTMIEVRIAVPIDTFNVIKNKKDIDKLDEILKEEINWADESNSERNIAKDIMDSYEQKKNTVKILIIVLIVFGIYNIIRLKRIIQENPKILPEQDVTYCRKIPDENASPSKAQFLYRFGKSFQTGDVISAILLNLSLKKFIEFEEIENEKKDVTIIVNPENKGILEKDEFLVFEFLKNSTYNNKTTLKKFRNYCEKNNESAYKLWQVIPDIAEIINIRDDNFDKEIARRGKKYGFAVLAWCMCILLGLLWILLFKLSIILVVIALINVIMSAITSKRFQGLTQKGIDERDKWDGLKNFMMDFSLLNEKSIPDLVLWEKYLVYATTFGIADKVLKQLKIKFPQLQDENYFRNNYISLYYCNRFDLGTKFQASLYKGYSAYIAETAKVAASTMSSGIGGGGGFSSGGGGGFGGGGGGGR